MSEAKEIAWDLSVIYKSTEDPEVYKKIDELLERAKNFAQAYKCKIQVATPKELQSILQTYESLLLDARELGQYASLSFSANQLLDSNKQLFNKVRMFGSEFEQIIAFFEVELSNYLLTNPTLVDSPELEGFKHYLEKLARLAPHKLSENEEKLLAAVNRTGIAAWQQFQSSHLGSKVFKLTINGETKELGFGAALGYLTHESKAVRRHAHEVIFNTLKEDSEIFATALRNISSYHVTMTKLRKYKNTLESSLVLNDIEEDMFQSLEKTVDEGKTLFQKYLKLKAKLMGVDVLDAEDVTAPVTTLPHKTYTWDEAKQIIIEAYKSFDPEFGRMIQSMFEEHRIDATPRKGKRQGAFCSGWSKGKSAFILTSFTGTLRSVYTLAHELGHAAHAILSEHKQPFLLQRVPMVIAEVASTFGEMILTDYLLNSAKTNEEKLAVLLGVLDNVGQTIFQVFARTWFEQATYQAIEQGEYLDAKRFAALWREARDKMHGDAVKWFEAMDYDMWTWKPHPYMYDYRFYNYPYVWSQLTSFAFYELYKKEGKAFVEKYKTFLSDGGSKSPAELVKNMGFDLKNPEFWNLGMKQYQSLVDQFESLL